MTLDLLTFKLVRESHQRPVTFLPNLGTLGFCVLELFAVLAQLLKFKVTQLWNSLPHDLTNTSSLASFRKKLKTYLRINPL